MWRVLKVENNSALLITRDIIDIGKYSYDGKAIWEVCALRKYLNNEFITNTFLEAQQKKIKQVKNMNLGNMEYNTYGGNDTLDKVFCLSSIEAKIYFDNDTYGFGENTDRVAILTDYVKAKIPADRVPRFLDQLYKGGNWWLRSPGGNDIAVAYVSGEGTIRNNGTIYNNEMGIRPALWLNLDS